MAPVMAPFEGRRLTLVASLVACLGAVGAAIGFIVDPKRALFAYLNAYAYCVSICVGALFVLMIGYAANATWMSVIRRVCETISLGIVPQLLLFAPIAVGMGQLYAWVDPPATASAHVLEAIAHKRPYLNPPFFVVRTLLYFAVWIAGAALLRRWSRARDRLRVTAGDPVEALSRERRFSCAMLVPVSLVTTFAAFDWLMSLQPEWFSSMFGIYYFSGAFVAALAAISLITYAGQRAGAFTGVLTPHHFHALGRMLFAFVIFWAYAAYFQVFLIGIADKPIEVSYYLLRMNGAWKTLGKVLIIGHFAVPFALLLPKSVKFHPWYVASLSAWILLMHFADITWLVLPTHVQSGVPVSWMEVSCLLALGGISIAYCAFTQRGAPVVAVGDPMLPEGIRYTSGT
jgi:hypothetical protein